MRRLKATEVKTYREQQLAKQGGVCPLCLQTIELSEAVLDHDHKRGVCRGVLHRGCNCMVGKIENARVRYKLTDNQSLGNLLSNIINYMSSSLDVLHPTHRTEEEKRVRRNARAKKKRALTKGNKNESKE